MLDYEKTLFLARVLFSITLFYGMIGIETVVVFKR